MCIRDRSITAFPVLARIIQERNMTKTPLGTLTIASAANDLSLIHIYIVNLRKITEVSRLRIIFDKNTYIPVGDNYKEKFTEYIGNLSLS